MLKDIDNNNGLNEWYSHIIDYIGNTERHNRREGEHSTLLRELNQKLKEYIRKNSPLKGNSQYHK